MEIPAGFRVVEAATAFEQEVAALVRRIPPGSVASYGRIAEWNSFLDVETLFPMFGLPLRMTD